MKKEPDLSEAGAEIVGALEGFLDVIRGGGEIAEHYTVRTVELDLRPREYAAEDVKKTRAILGLSQVLFAQFLGVSVQAVRAWERGSRELPPMARRFLDEIAASPEHWKARLRASIVAKDPKDRPAKRQPS